MTDASATEPDWLSQRRRKGASLARELALPTQKAKGWEFTDLSELDLDVYSPHEGEVEGVDAGVDSADGPPVVMPLAEAAGRLGDLVEERFGSLISVDDPFVARNEPSWRATPRSSGWRWGSAPRAARCGWRRGSPDLDHRPR